MLKAFSANKLKTAFLIISFLGILLSTYLWQVQAQAESPDFFIPCTDNGCENVLTSDYSKLLGVPISVFGLFFYCFMALVSFQRIYISHKLLDYIFYALLAWGLVFSLYLRYLEFAKIGDVCIWCWVSFLMILAMCGMSIYEFRASRL